MLIRGEGNNASVELSEAQGLAKPSGSESYRVTLRENEFEVSYRVYAFDPHDNGLSKFFSELAQEWKGWDGPKIWKSLEGEFELQCQHDRVGHVTTTATLHSNAYGNGWTGQIRFDIAAGQLEDAAAGVKRFFERHGVEDESVNV